MRAGKGEKLKEEKILLFASIGGGEIEIFKGLLEKGYSPNTERNGWSLLHEAADWNQVPIARLIVERGGSVNPRDRFERTSHSFQKGIWGNGKVSSGKWGRD